MGYSRTRSQSQPPMLRPLNTPSNPTDATIVASVLPCRHSFDMERQPESAQNLAARCAR